METSQIKSKERISDYGEVFTSKREVDAMLDLVKQETQRIESKFLEPACGTGNFLIEILNMKLTNVANRYKVSQTECEKYFLIAIGSLYGIDLLEDNVVECRGRMFELFSEVYRSTYKEAHSEMFENVIRYVLKNNIVCGDALTMKNALGDNILFIEWTSTTGSFIKRRAYSFDDLVRVRGKQTSLLDMGWERNTGAQYIPIPVRDYPAKHYMELDQNES